MLNLIVLLFCFLVSFSVFADKFPNDVRWVRNSQEYEIICTQIFRDAKLSVEEHAKSVKLKKPNSVNKRLAVVVDLDETILDNSLYQIERWKAGLEFTQQSWSKWVNRKEAGLVPGAKDFLDFVRHKKIQVIFLSNRLDENLGPTKTNLSTFDLLGKNDIFLLRQEKSDTKEKRRNEVLNGTGRMKSVGPFNVISYLGDQVGDFPNKNLKDFGKKYFLFPNPMYGKW